MNSNGTKRIELLIKFFNGNNASFKINSSIIRIFFPRREKTFLWALPPCKA